MRSTLSMAPWAPALSGRPTAVLGQSDGDTEAELRASLVNETTSTQDCEGCPVVPPGDPLTPREWNAALDAWGHDFPVGPEEWRKDSPDYGVPRIITADEVRQELGSPTAAPAPAPQQMVTPTQSLFTQPQTQGQPQAQGLPGASGGSSSSGQGWDPRGVAEVRAREAQGASPGGIVSHGPEGDRSVMFGAFLGQVALVGSPFLSQSET